MLKIVHCVPNLQVGGAEMMLLKVTRYLDPNRFSSFVVSLTDPGPMGDMLEEAGAHVTTLGTRGSVPDLRVAWRLSSFLRSHGSDVLLQTYMYGPNLYGLICAKLAHVPVIWGIRCSDMDFRYYNPLTGLAFRLNAMLSSQPDVIVANSMAGMRYHVQRGFDGSRMVVVSNGFELDRFQPNPSHRISMRRELELPASALVIGMIGRFDPAKDHRTFFEAAGRLARSLPDVSFLLAGKGITLNNPTIASCIHRAGLDGKVFALGSRNDMPRIMASLDLLALSSAFEGFPNVLGEAMACEVPCVVTDVGDSAYIVGKTGRVVPPRSPDLLAKAMEEMLFLPAEGRRNLGHMARERVQQNFDIRRTVQALSHIYETVAGGGAVATNVVSAEK